MSKMKVALVAMVVLIGYFAFARNTDTQTAPRMGIKGQWKYDAAGNHVGCVSPGNDCSWGN